MKAWLVLLWCSTVVGFAPSPVLKRRAFKLSSATEGAAAQATTSDDEKQAKRLGLLTFDLDDTLYPIATVIDEANQAFVRAMNNFGFSGIKPSDIDETGRKIRQEIAEKDPEAAAVLTHTEIRMLAIRREMETIILDRKLKATAEDWACEVRDLSSIITRSARQWATNAVSESVVQAVHTAWEMERYHAAERNLYPEVVDVLKQIKKEHPEVIIGAVTDGKANPMLMTFTLAPYFDFCVSWEDDQGGRRNFFKELATAESNAELSWIYEAAKDKYHKLAAANAEIDAAAGGAPKSDDGLWIHVGDDLAYDVGGSSGCGAKTIYVELAPEYGQTARKRFEGGPQPTWSTSGEKELEKREKMNEAAKQKIDKTIEFITRLPEAINDILEEEEA